MRSKSRIGSFARKISDQVQAAERRELPIKMQLDIDYRSGQAGRLRDGLETLFVHESGG
jgi:hypothetical protein